MPVAYRLFFSLFFLASLQVYGDEIIENFYSTKAMGMGNAFSSIVDDHTALFINPAGIDKIRGMHITLLNAGLGTDALDIYNVFTSAMTGNWVTFLQNYYGRTIWANLSDTLAFSMKGFAFAAYDTFNMSFDMHNPAYPNLNLSATNDYGLTMGGALSLVPKIWRLGVSVKRVTRYGGRVNFGPSTLVTLNNSTINSLINNMGTGYGLDAGTLITLPFGSYPTLSFVWHDIGQTRFIAVPGSNAPTALDNEAVFGASATFDFKAVKIRPAMDFKHVFRVDYPLAERIHMGAEFAFPGGFSIRGGLNQGYWTAGASLNLSYVQMDLASYGVEMGTYPGQTEDRRYMLNLIFDININTPFSGDDDGAGGSGPGGRGPAGARRGSIYQRR